MNSCIYRCEVTHHRFSPKQHRFRYSIFMFYIDLDETDALHQSHFFFSKNKFNWFSFRDRDHFQSEPGNAIKSVRENIIQYLRNQNIPWDGGKIKLLTNVAIFGYTFNPISIYVCHDKRENPSCAIAEVSNTHGEMKMYLIGSDHFLDDTFRKTIPKLFYVSPFTELDASFDFIINVPNENLHVRVDDYQNGKRFLMSSLKGVRKEFSDLNLFFFGLRFPFVTIKIISLIYWQALVLMLKGIPWKKKNFNLHMQTDLYSTKKM